MNIQRRVLNKCLGKNMTGRMTLCPSCDTSQKMPLHYRTGERFCKECGDTESEWKNTERYLKDAGASQAEIEEWRKKFQKAQR